MTDPLEIEFKLECAAADREKLDSCDPLAGIAGVAGQLVSTYFDTPDLDLSKAGYSLRIRRAGRRRIQTVKAVGEASAGLFVRPEWERPVKGDVPILDDKSGPLAQLVPADVLARIRPAFSVEVQRTVRRLTTAEADIEIAVDHGAARAGRRQEPICEIELELKGGSAQALFDLAHRIDAHVPLRLGVRTKSERGYALAGAKPATSVKADPIRLNIDGDAGESFHTIAAGCVRHFRLNENLLLQSGDAEALHQARVALRRLRSAFSLYRSLLKGDIVAKRLRGELRWLAAELGEVRNIDVLIPRLEGEPQQLLVAARRRAIRRVRAELASQRARLLMIDLVEWLSLGRWRTQPARPKAFHQPVAIFAADLFDRHRKHIKRCGKGLADLGDEHRHEVRIEAKTLRYATEFFRSLYADGKANRRYRRFLSALEALQEHLGELNDFAVGPQVLAALGIEASLPVAGKHERRHLLAKAEEAYEALIDAKRFWRK